MPEISAIGIREVLEGSVTQDGRHVLLTFVQGGGAELCLAIPQGQMGGLLGLCAETTAESQRKLGLGAPVIAVTGWQVDALAESADIALTLSMGPGTALTFRLPGGDIQGLRDTLTAALAMGGGH